MVSLNARGRKYRRILLVLICLYGIGTFMFGRGVWKTVPFIFRNENMNEPCTIPAPDPFDPTIMKYHWVPDPLECDVTPVLVYVDNVNTLHLNMTSLGYHGVKWASEVTCEIRNVIRSGDFEIGFTAAVSVSLPVNLTSDFSRVSCKRSGNAVIYDNILTSVIKKNIASSKKKPKFVRKKPINVVLIGIDSVSRSASVRHLRKTRKILEQLGGHDFTGYMKIGDSTGPNVIPLLTGRKLDQNECPGMEGAPLNNAPFLWSNFSRAGYATMYAEDVPHRTVFNTMFKGFREEPTDHYIRPFFLAQHTKDNAQYKLSGILKFLENRGVSVKKGSVFCYQDKPKHEIILDYLRRFMRQYEADHVPTFSFTFLTELSHSFINFLAYGDDYLTNFARWVKDTGLLDNTMLIFFGDHGPRYTDIRNTFVGRIESRMPFLNIVLSTSLKQAHPELDKNLKLNTQRLVTVYDIHQTLVDVLNNRLNNPSNQVLPDGSIRGISLFNEIPKDRSCAQAWIPEEFCACYKSTAVNVTNNVKLKKIALNIVSAINGKTATQHKCKRLSLSKILSAELVSPGLKHAGVMKKGFSFLQFTQPEKNREKYRVSIETIPGHGTYDATCEYHDSIKVFKVVGEIDRTNLYGNQSICTPHYRLKPYCYC